MGNSPGYVWEKMYVAIDAMCGRGDVKERLANATESALMRLTDDDMKGTPLYEDLQHVLSWTKGNMLGGEIQKLPDELEHNKLIEKMLHILLETARAERDKYDDA
jgi:hypothetical protein